jgi:uncharacterized repeat protein (TIGR01451 family)/uncharacterized protein (TIGR03382 family)
MPSRRLPLFLAALLAPAAFGADIRILNKNDSGQGFNDTTPVTPVGLNFGTTIGQQALIAFQYAATIWGATLRSSIPIVIDSAFVTVQQDARLQCTTSSGIVGFARLASYSKNDSYPVPGAAYPVALANTFVGKDLTPGDAHIVARFNASLGTPGCLDNQRWYYGLDGKESASQDDLVSVVLHEFGHGLGFISFVDPTSGSSGSDPPSIFDFHAWDISGGIAWQADTDAQRQALAVSLDGLSLDGAAIAVDVPRFLSFPPASLSVDASGQQSPVPFAAASFSGPFTGGGTIAMAQPLNACPGLTNPTDLTGKVALIQRGGSNDAGVTCRFWDKASQAQDAGAVGVILFNNQAGAPLLAPSGSPTLSIPVGFVTLETGANIQAQAVSGSVSAAFASAPTRSGVDGSGNRPLLYTPAAVVSASSVSHFDTSAFPTLLMEPRILRSFQSNLDLTPAVMADLGWSVVKGLSVAVGKALEAQVSPGKQATYLVTLVNRSPAPANDVSVDLSLPPGTTVVSTAGACTTAFPCNLGTMASSGVALTLVTLQLPSSVPNPFPVTARVSTSTPTGDDVLESTSSLPSASSSGCSSSGGAPSFLSLGVLFSALLVRPRRR